MQQQLAGAALPVEVGVGGGGTLGDSHIEQTGMLVGKFEFNP